jgi:hypothetical protein
MDEALKILRAVAMELWFRLLEGRGSRLNSDRRPGVPWGVPRRFAADPYGDEVAKVRFAKFSGARDFGVLEPALAASLSPGIEKVTISEGCIGCAPMKDVLVVVLRDGSR